MEFEIIQSLIDCDDILKIDYQKLEFDKVDLNRLLGYLSVNRMAPIAYQKIIKKDIKMLKKNTEFMRSLDVIYQYSCIKNKFMKKDIEFISKILEQKKLRYAFLKGAFLSTEIYPIGLRTSNDIDILLHMDDLEEVEQILERCGFVQGYIDYNGELKHASRLEIIKARMNYGEVVPYTYVFDDHSMRLDINLSLDYKPLENGKVIDNMLKNRTCFSVDDYTQSPTLNIMDFIIHLCCHLYKEATTYNWVERNRDLSLYKFVDIYKCLLKYMNEKNGNNLLETIRKYHVEKECYYTLKNTIEIFPALMNIKGVKELLVNIKPENLDFMNRVIYPERKIMYEYTIGFSERLLKNDKILYLKKIENE